MYSLLCTAPCTWGHDPLRGNNPEVPSTVTEPGPTRKCIHADKTNPMAGRQRAEVCWEGKWPGEREKSIWGSCLGVTSSDQNHKLDGNLQEQELICKAAHEQRGQPGTNSSAFLPQASTDGRAAGDFLGGQTL